MSDSMSAIYYDECEYLNNCRVLKETPVKKWNPYAGHDGMWVYDIYGDHAESVKRRARELEKARRTRR